MSADGLSLWALPADRDRDLLADRIDRLAAAAGTGRFAPHLTVVGRLAPGSDAAGLEPALAAHRAFPAQLIGIRDSDKHYECLTLAADGGPALRRLRVDLARACGAPTGQFRPHVSLVYGDLPAQRRRDLRRLVDLPLPLTITIEAVALVDVRPDRAEDWPVLARWPLAESAGTGPG